MFNERHSKFIHITRGTKKVISPQVMLNINMLVKARKLKKGSVLDVKLLHLNLTLAKSRFECHDTTEI